MLPRLYFSSFTSWRQRERREAIQSSDNCALRLWIASSASPPRNDTFDNASRAIGIDEFFCKAFYGLRNSICVSFLILAVFMLGCSPSLAATPAASSSSSSTITATAPSSSKATSSYKARKKAKPIAPLFDMTDLNGARVTDTSLRGKPVLVVFGYTFCPDACPTGLQNLSRLLDLMGESANKVHAVFITLDPDRDSEAKLKDYLMNFHPSILGLRGTPAQTAAAAKALHVTFAKAEAVGEQDYEMDYSPVLTVIDAEGRVAEALDDENAPEELLKILQKHIPLPQQ
ncbi:MAG: SCO family protein [Bdellovibrionales bacterium]